MMRSQCPPPSGCISLLTESSCRDQDTWSSSALVTMKATLLIFLYLLTVGETARKFISPEGRLPRDYLEEKNEGDDDDDDDYDDDDDDENTPNVEQSPEPERISVSQTDDGVGVLEKSMEKLQEKAQVTSPEEEEEESSQEEQALESRLGPHYLTHSGQSHSEELPLHVSHMADLPERNTGQETKQDCKVNVVLVVSCIALDCFFMLLISCWILYVKYRVKRWVLSSAYTGQFQ